jgi:hypothetical protein
MAVDPFGRAVRDHFHGERDEPLIQRDGETEHALYFQERFETVAIEVSENLVALMDERGVEDARVGDMFTLRDQFERDRFQSALANGTQAGLAGSMDGLRQLLCDLAYVTEPDGTAVLDFYDPEGEGASDLLGYRADPTPGLAFRVMTFEYEDDVADTLLFRLFSPDRLRAVTIGTSWTVEDVRYASDNEYHYRAGLEKQ